MDPADLGVRLKSLEDLLADLEETVGAPVMGRERVGSAPLAEASISLRLLTR